MVAQGVHQEAWTQTAATGADPSRTGEDLGSPPSGANPTYPTPDEAKVIPGEIIVTLEEDATQADLKDINRETGARTEENLPKSDVNLVDLPRDLTVQEAVERYEADPDVEDAQPNYRLYPTKTPNDELYAKYEFGLNNTGQTGGTPDADIDAPEAWEATTGSSGTVVAVIDEGVDINHPDLKDNIWVNQDEIPGNGIDDDGNGYVDDVNGWDFQNDDASVYDPITDPNTGQVSGDEHGTHVAGTIAARGNNSIGVAGVSWQTRIMPLKFLGPNGGSTIDAVEAIDYAVREGVKISNNSWGGGGYNKALRDAIQRADDAGHLFVTSAGNAGANNDTAPSYPASYDLPNIISVAATDKNDALAGFSNVGATSVDLGAPGVSIASTYPKRDYGYMSGTSMASPHVAGVAALIKSQDSGLDDGQIKAKILQSVDNKQSLSGKTVTGGRLNAAQALGIKLTNLSLGANPLALTYGRATTLSGRLTSYGDPVGGGTVVLEQRPVGAARFSKFNRVAIRSDGTFSLAGVKPVKGTEYRVRFEGNKTDQFGPSTSPARRVNVRTVVTLNTSSTNLKLGKERVIAGAVRPLHGGTVTVVIKRNGGVIARKNVVLNSSSQYRFVYKPQQPGRYAFFATFPKHADHLGNRSPQKGFKVVR